MTAAVSNIWKDFHEELKTFIRKKIGNTDDADDVLQNLFVRIMRNINKVYEARDLRQYLYGMVRNAVHDYYRNKTKAMADVEHIEILSETETVSLNATIAECCIRPFINKLPTHYKEALLLTEFHNLSQKELAQKLNISYSGAKSRVQRGKDKLKEMLLACCAYQSDAYGNLSSEQDPSCACQ